MTCDEKSGPVFSVFFSLFSICGLLILSAGCALLSGLVCAFLNGGSY